MSRSRRTTLIEALLEVPGGPAAFRPAERDRVAKALALIIGTEAVVVFSHVLPVDEAAERPGTVKTSRRPGFRRERSRASPVPGGQGSLRQRHS